MVWGVYNASAITVLVEKLARYIDFCLPTGENRAACVITDPDFNRIKSDATRRRIQGE